jgi:hypothetical protein
VALDHGASGSGERRVLVQAVAHQGQAAVGCIDFGSGLLESESTHEPKSTDWVNGCQELLYRSMACYCRL